MDSERHGAEHWFTRSCLFHLKKTYSDTHTFSPWTAGKTQRDAPDASPLNTSTDLLKMRTFYIITIN